MKKVRVTVTMDSNLLEVVDRAVRDRSIQAIRLKRKPVSRSQVIEEFIRQSVGRMK